MGDNNDLIQNDESMEQREWRINKPTRMIRNASNIVAKDLNRETQLTFNSMQNNAFQSRDES